ncbi:MAG: PilW family protein [Deltaproteobacteria bacterium]|jgi:prepilin-type N-terminal cleavage/methylation domain-containing protein|nr:PilW family protein [Deltaproteobacteria bacterium]
MTMGKPYKTIQRPGAKNRPGLTLVELLTVMLLGAILLSMALLIYITTSRSYIRQDSLVEQMLNLRSAMAFITRDLRMAGNGFSLLELGQDNRLLIYTKDIEGKPNGWFRYDPAVPDFGVQPIWFEGNTDGPDKLTVVYLAPEFSAPLGRLSSSYSAGDSYLSLVESSTLEYPVAEISPNEILAVQDQVAVVSTDKRALILEAKSNASDLTKIEVVPTPTPFQSSYLKGSSNFPAGSLVYNVRQVHVHSFRVDPDNDSLVMDSLQESKQPLAEGIEDLQVAFAVAKSNPAVEDNLVQALTGYDLSDPGRILKVARVILVSRSLTEDPYHNTYPRIKALDHNPTGADAYRRRALEAIVSLRNF